MKEIMTYNKACTLLGIQPMEMYPSFQKLDEKTKEVLNMISIVWTENQSNDLRLKRGERFYVARYIKVNQKILKDSITISNKEELKALKTLIYAERFNIYIFSSLKDANKITNLFEDTFINVAKLTY